VAVDQGKCIGCGRCVRDRFCYLGALSIIDGKAVVDENLCKGCGRCVERCASHAIQLVLHDSDFLRRTIARIEPLVDVMKE
jgi:heterodisulfide reductase subunit A-like polyferredoxin